MNCYLHDKVVQLYGIQVVTLFIVQQSRSLENMFCTKFSFFMLDTAYFSYSISCYTGSSETWCMQLLIIVQFVLIIELEYKINKGTVPKWLVTADS